MDSRDIRKLVGLGESSLDHVPVYATKEAVDAILKVMKLEDQNLFRPGLYYIVLIDLVGSTHASSVLGPEVNRERVETFVKSTIAALKKVKLIEF